MSIMVVECLVLSWPDELKKKGIKEDQKKCLKHETAI